MRKTPSKLALRKETLRALSSMDLGRVVGGQEDDAVAAVEGSEAKNCPIAALALTA